jgi:hypothetical protein
MGAAACFAVSIVQENTLIATQNSTANNGGKAVVKRG